MKVKKPYYDVWCKDCRHKTTAKCLDCRYPATALKPTRWERIGVGASKNKETTTDQLIFRLRKYNDWRRGAETAMPEPQQIGHDIDEAINLLETQVQCLESQLSQARTQIAEITEELIEELEEVVEFAPECTSSKKYAEKRLKELKGGDA